MAGVTRHKYLRHQRHPPLAYRAYRQRSIITSRITRWRQQNITHSRAQRGGVIIKRKRVSSIKHIKHQALSGVISVMKVSNSVIKRIWRDNIACVNARAARRCCCITCCRASCALLHRALAHAHMFSFACMAHWRHQIISAIENKRAAAMLHRGWRSATLSRSVSIVIKGNKRRQIKSWRIITGMYGGGSRAAENMAQHRKRQASS